MIEHKCSTLPVVDEKGRYVGLVDRDTLFELIPSVALWEAKAPVAALIAQGESKKLEFKSTLRWHIHKKAYDDVIQHAVLKTIAAFLNSDGGTLLIGVNDNGEALGLEKDDFPNADKMMLHLTNLVRDRMGTIFMRFLKLSVEEVDGKQIFRVVCQSSTEPVYLRFKNSEYFYIRTGPSTDELPASQIHGYIQDRFYST